MASFIVKMEKDWTYKNLRCVVIMTCMGHRCGYVGVSKTHSLYGKDYDEKIEISDVKKQEFERSDIGKRGIIPFLFRENITIDTFFDVHGGITYADGGENSDYPVESDLWWFGYDCGHSGDEKDLSAIDDEKTKEFFIKHPYPNGIVRTLEYCISECESLAEQLLKFEEEKI